MAKVFASETAIECSMEAMRILGGYGFTVDFPVERYYRDAPLMAIGEGTNEILQLLDRRPAAGAMGRRRDVTALDVVGQPGRRRHGAASAATTSRSSSAASPSPPRASCSSAAACPRPREVRVLDAVLNAVLDYALLKPGTVAARYAVSANPSMVGRLAAAVLVRRPLHAGTRGHRPLHHSTPTTGTWRPAARSRRPRRRSWTTPRAATERIPGFGHPLFKRIDPRAQRLKDVAVAEGLWSEQAELYEHDPPRLRRATGKPDIPINDVGMMAVVLLELGFSPDEMTGLAMLSTLPGVIAHVSEELRDRPSRSASCPTSRSTTATCSTRDLRADR